MLRVSAAVQPGQEDMFDGKPLPAPSRASASGRFAGLSGRRGRNRSQHGRHSRRTVVMYHRCNDRARTPYSITPNVPMQGDVAPMNVPGFNAQPACPTFLYMWQPEPRWKNSAVGNSIATATVTRRFWHSSV